MTAGVIPDWAAFAELRRAGLGAYPIAPQDIHRCWAHACLTANSADLRWIAGWMRDLWDGLPEELRRSGNGKRLEAFLAATADLTSPDWPTLLQLPLPAPRPV